MKKHFTLVEVIVAMAIMALALTAFFALSQSAVNRIDKAYSNWERTHLLSQAAEYYLFQVILLKRLLAVLQKHR